MNSLGPVKQDPYGFLISVLHFQHYLSAGSARRNGGGEIALVATSRYGYGGYGLVGMLVLSVEYGRTLGTKAQGERGVLLIAARDERAVLQSQGRPDTEL